MELLPTPRYFWERGPGGAFEKEDHRPDAEFKFLLDWALTSPIPPPAQENRSHSKRNYLKCEQMMGSFIDNLMFSFTLMGDESSRAKLEQLQKNRSSFSCKLESMPQTFLTKKMDPRTYCFFRKKKKKKLPKQMLFLLPAHRANQTELETKTRDYLSNSFLKQSKLYSFTVFQTNNRKSDWQEIHRQLLFRFASFLIKKKKKIPSLLEGFLISNRKLLPSLPIPLSHCPTCGVMLPKACGDARLSPDPCPRCATHLQTETHQDSSSAARDLRVLVCQNRGGLQIIESREVVARGWGRGGSGEFLSNEYGVLLSPMTEFWRQTAVTVAQQWECAECH